MKPILLKLMLIMCCCTFATEKSNQVSPLLEYIQSFYERHHSKAEIIYIPNKIFVTENQKNDTPEVFIKPNFVNSFTIYSTDSLGNEIKEHFSIYVVDSISCQNLDIQNKICLTRNTVDSIKNSIYKVLEANNINHIDNLDRIINHIPSLDLLNSIIKITPLYSGGFSLNSFPFITSIRKENDFYEAVSRDSKGGGESEKFQIVNNQFKIIYNHNESSFWIE